jgi:hypothetical protein
MWAALSAVEAIALAQPGMILIREVADAPVITGISKPAGLKIHNREVKLWNNFTLALT